MEKKKNYVRISVVREGTAREFDGDPNELWLDQDIELRQLIKLDPFNITPEMVDAAEQPELADPLLTSLPRRRTSFRREEAWLKRHRAEAQQKLAHILEGSK